MLGYEFLFVLRDYSARLVLTAESRRQRKMCISDMLLAYPQLLPQSRHFDFVVCDFHCISFHPSFKLHCLLRELLRLLLQLPSQILTLHLRLRQTLSRHASLHRRLRHKQLVPRLVQLCTGKLPHTTPPHVLVVGT